MLEILREPVSVIIRSKVNQALGVVGYKLTKAGYPPDIDTEFRPVYQRVHPYSLTTPEALFALWKACRYVEQATIPGCFVEVGVWRGGSSMVAALTLKDRPLYLYDTYEGLPRPGMEDVCLHGSTSAMDRWERNRKEGHNEWCYAPLQDVQQNMRATGYPEHLLHFPKGKVEDTQRKPFEQAVAILRVDVDWYEPTVATMQNLYPALVPGGVLILDDYGSWRGARKAVDDYFSTNGVNMLLNRVDYTVRVGIKPSHS
jgi:hypothetical protein